MAGFSDGTVKMLDSRIGLFLPTQHSSSGGTSNSRKKSIVQEWDCDEWVVYASPISDHTFLAGTSNGAILTLDRRWTMAPISTVMQASGDISAMASNKDFLAIGTLDKKFAIHQVSNGEFLNSINFSDALCTQKGSPVASVAFHSQRALVAAASNSDTVAVYGLHHR